MRISDWSSDGCSSDFDGGVQIAKGHPARVGGIIAETDQRMASLDPVALQHRGGFEKLDLETRAPAGVGFARQAVGVEDIAVEIDGTARRADDGEAQSLGSDRKSTRLNSSH